MARSRDDHEDHADDPQHDHQDAANQADDGHGPPVGALQADEAGAELPPVVTLRGSSV